MNAHLVYIFLFKDISTKTEENRKGMKLLNRNIAHFPYVDLLWYASGVLNDDFIVY